MTTKRERLEAAIVGDVADRPPVALWRHFPVDDQDPSTLAEASSEFQSLYDFDFIKVTPASSFCLRDWGVEDKWRGNPEGTRDYTRRVINDSDVWLQLYVLDPESGSLARQLRCLELIRELVGHDVPIIQTIFNPLAQAKNLAGQNEMLAHLKRYPEKVQIGLETITKSTIAFVEAAQSRGIDGIFYAIQHASFDIFDRQGYAKYGETYDQRIIDAAGDLWLNVLHLHGDSLMFDLAEVYPVHIVNWHDRETSPDLVAGKRRINAAVCGGISRETLTIGDPHAVRIEADEAIESLNGQGLILGTGCVVPVIAPRANLKAARACVDFA